MTSQPDVLANIKAGLQQAIERKKPKEQTIKFTLDGEIRACLIAKPFNYDRLLKSIEDLFGHHTLKNLDTIRCVLSRDDSLRFSIRSDEDLQKLIAIAEANGTAKLNFQLILKKISSSSTTKTCETNNGEEGKTDDPRLDSPPPGTITSQKRRTTVNPSTRSNDGGFFIPEATDEMYSSGGSSVVSRESGSGESSTGRRVPMNDLIRRARATSNVSSGSIISSSSNSSRTSSSSSESLCTQCVSSAQHFKSPLTPSNWKLGRQIGQGAFGKVYLCYDVDTGSDLAIKQIPIRGLDSESSREVKILECEINIYKQLNHERIVRYYGAARTDEYLQIFMEYMTGGSVREQILNYGALTETLTKKYTKQIIEGLIYLHQNRFVHRDIKCANILRDISGNVKLGDFGTSRRLLAITNQNQQDSGTIGTAHWTAPEIIQGSVFGRKADIWSLGCTIVEMLTTGPPWQNLQPIAAIFHIATRDKPQYDLPENTSNSAREFIDACLTKDYHQRPTGEALLTYPFLADVQSSHNYHHPQQQTVSVSSATTNASSVEL